MIIKKGYSSRIRKNIDYLSHRKNIYLTRHVIRMADEDAQWDTHDYIDTKQFKHTI